MSPFYKSKKQEPPSECRGMKIQVQSSICTGEKTIGFFDPVSKRLLYSELVRSDEDVRAFYEKYGIEYTK